MTDFTKQYRTYVINYGLGQDWFAPMSKQRGRPKARWARMERILSEPTFRGT